ncbi:hypothetical protein GXP70_02975 [Paenibacillus lycopersici]|uniref:Uncharacterized protein n=1 Tax=Paenibacillus lycopersici TaxID=2704462 RepID=A0A6C0FPH6_9BACL|nr:hypothetical protein [Paenibacillus lycopersici]QHT59026.1 hypothetical protein GXP70_02975 [Paenibacillus lycopersici]
MEAENLLAAGELGFFAVPARINLNEMELTAPIEKYYHLTHGSRAEVRALSTASKGSHDIEGYRLNPRANDAQAASCMPAHRSA